MTEDEEEEDVAIATSRSSARRPSSRNTKTRNGKKTVDMTPPNRLLEKSLKLAARYGEKKKVKYKFFVKSVHSRYLMS